MRPTNLWYTRKSIVCLQQTRTKLSSSDPDIKIPPAINLKSRRLKSCIIVLISNVTTSTTVILVRKHTTYSHQDRTGSPSYRQEPKLKALRKSFPTNNRKTDYWPNYKRKFVGTLTSNGHQYIIDKNFKVTDTIGETTKHSK